MIVDQWVIGNHSMINTRDFASPKKLAEYIHKLNNNDQLYYQYVSLLSLLLSSHDKWDDR